MVIIIVRTNFFIFPKSYTLIIGRPDRRKSLKNILPKPSSVRGRQSRKKKIEDVSEEDQMNAEEIANMWEALNDKIIHSHPHIRKVARTIYAFEKNVMGHYHGILRKKSHE